MLKVSMEYRKRILLVRLKGNLNLNTSPKLLEYMCPIVKMNNIKYIVLNIGDVSSMDDIGVNALLRVKKDIKGKNGKLLVLNKDSSHLDERLVALNVLNVYG